MLKKFLVGGGRNVPTFTNGNDPANWRRMLHLRPFTISIFPSSVLLDQKIKISSILITFAKRGKPKLLLIGSFHIIFLLFISKQFSCATLFCLRSFWKIDKILITCSNCLFLFLTKLIVKA